MSFKHVSGAQGLSHRLIGICAITKSHYNMSHFVPERIGEELFKALRKVTVALDRYIRESRKPANAAGTPPRAPNLPIEIRRFAIGLCCVGFLFGPN